VNVAAAQNSQRKRLEIGFVLKALLIRSGNDRLSPDSDWQAVTHYLYSLPFAPSVRYSTSFPSKWIISRREESLGSALFIPHLNSLSYAVVHK